MATKTNDKMQVYNDLRSVPKEATKTIKGGRLNGFTDINPMWRIQRLTETFGPCGLGWYTEIVDRWIVEGNGEISAHVRIKLYVRYEAGEWSAPIEGIGGSTLLKKESNGAYHSDEAFKMAYTDAISVACKALGMAADIYFAKGVQMKDNRTKYDAAAEAPAPAPQDAGTPAETGYFPVDEDTYWNIVAAYAKGKMSKSGRPYDVVWIEQTGAGKPQIDRFYADVDNYKTAHGLNK